MKTTLKNKLSSFISKFSAQEIGSIVLAVLISVPILIYGLKDDTKDTNTRGFTPIVANRPTYDITGTRVQLFDTSFYINYENNASEIELALVEQVINDYLVPYHKLFDRHSYYFVDEIEHPSRPSLEQQNTLPRIKNLRYVNEHLNEWVEVDYALYDLLSQAIDLSLKTNGNFNPFVGELYDFWAELITGEGDYPAYLDPLINESRRTRLETLLSYVPKTNEAIKDALLFNEIDNKYYVKLVGVNNPLVGQVSITLGGIAKGYMTDIMKEVMNRNKLYRGYIYGGASSITTLSENYFGEPLKINMASIHRFDDGRRDPNASFSFARTDKYSMSTSGTYEGKLFIDPNDEQAYLRSHIINPFTGYPANHNHQLVSVISHDLSGTELEILSTSLIVMTMEEGVQFIRDNYTDIDINIVYLTQDNSGYSLYRNDGFDGVNTSYYHISDIYREKILENV